MSICGIPSGVLAEFGRRHGASLRFASVLARSRFLGPWPVARYPIGLLGPVPLQAGGQLAAWPDRGAAGWLLP